MAEINLLKTPGGESGIISKIPGLFVKLLVLAALGVVSYYGFLYYKGGKLTKQITETETNIAQIKAESLSLEGRNELLTRQGQLKEFITLTQGHNYVSKLLPELSKTFLKSAYLTNFSMTGDGKITMSVVVPTLVDLDKFLQVYNHPQVSQNFNNVRVGSFGKIQGATQSMYRVEVQMSFNPAVLKNGPVSGK